MMTQFQYVLVLGVNVTLPLNWRKSGKKKEFINSRWDQMKMDMGQYVSNILSTEPLPNLNRVYAMIVQQERVRTMTRTKEERGSPMSFAVQVGG